MRKKLLFSSMYTTPTVISRSVIDFITFYLALEWTKGWWWCTAVLNNKEYWSTACRHHWRWGELVESSVMSRAQDCSLSRLQRKHRSVSWTRRVSLLLLWEYVFMLLLARVFLLLSVFSTFLTLWTRPPLLNSPLTAACCKMSGRFLACLWQSHTRS